MLLAIKMNLKGYISTICYVMHREILVPEVEITVEIVVAKKLSIFSVKWTPGDLEDLVVTGDSLGFL